MDFETLLRDADPARAVAVPGSESPAAQAALESCVADERGSRHHRPRALRYVAALRSPTSPGMRLRPLAAGGVLAPIAVGVAAALILGTAAGPATHNHPTVGRPVPFPIPPAQPGLIAALTYDGLPADPGDAAAVLRKLADRAAAQPAPPALGPVWYTKAAVWGSDLGPPHYGLDYRAHEFQIMQDWEGPTASLEVTRYPDGRVPPGIIPISRSAWEKPSPYTLAHNPATLPTTPAALRRRFLSWDLSPSNVVPPRHPLDLQVYFDAVSYMEEEPLPPAARAGMLRLMAGIVAKPPRHTDFVDIGAVTDRAGQPGIAIGEVEPGVQGQRSFGRPGDPSYLTVDIFDPATGALLGEEPAACSGPVTVLTVHTVNEICAPDSYTQYLQIKAVPSVPPAPKRGH